MPGVRWITEEKIYGHGKDDHCRDPLQTVRHGGYDADRG
jgi:hypothetical protein